jgi:hypothetical protein
VSRLFEEAECVDWVTEGRDKDKEVWRVFAASCKDKDLLRNRVDEVRRSDNPGSSANKSRVLEVANTIDTTEWETRDHFVGKVDTVKTKDEDKNSGELQAGGQEKECELVRNNVADFLL